MLKKSEPSAPRILIVDDDIHIREVITMILKREIPEARIEEAENGYVAGCQIHGFRPDLVILDIMMPGLDGFGFCRLIRDVPHLKAVRILIMSGVPDPDLDKKAKQFGANGSLTKPFNSDILKKEVLRQLCL